MQTTMMRTTTMKCIKTEASRFGTVSADDSKIVVRRVDEITAARLVRHDGWEYATRREWKKGGRLLGLGFAGE
jgi:hypothetical protein